MEHTDVEQYTDRPYSGEEDFRRMRALLSESLRITGPPEYGTAGDLDWWRASDPQETGLRAAHLWFAGDALVAFLWPEGNRLDMFTHPKHRALEVEMLAWEEQRRSQNPPADGASLSLPVLESDGRRRDLALSHGYAATDDHYLYWMQPLPATMPARPLPAGYAVRNVQGEPDFAARVAAHRSAFAPSRMTLEKYERTRAMAGYREEHDIIAVAPDGTIAAFCIIWNDGVSGVGAFEPVGTHAEHQQRGLGRAVLAEGLRRLAAEGAHTAVVVSNGGRDASQRLYQSAGFRLLDRIFAYERPSAGRQE